MIDPLPDIHVDSSKHKLVTPVNVSSSNATVIKEERDEEMKFNCDSV